MSKQAFSFFNPVKLNGVSAPFIYCREVTELFDIVRGTVTCDGRETDYAKIGNGSSDFIIIPGISLKKVTPSAAAIRGQYLRLLESGRTVWIFDRINNPPEGYTIQDMAEDTVKAMKKLGIGKAEFFGSSQGGAICLCTAISHPEVTSAVVCGSSLSHCNDYFLGMMKKWMDLAVRKKGRELIEYFGSCVYAPETWEKYRDAIIEANGNVSDEEYRAFSVMTKSLMSFDIRDRLKEITCPLFVIGCEGDRIVTPGPSREIAEATGCEIFMYGNEYGHGVYDEASDYAERILGFLEK